MAQQNHSVFVDFYVTREQVPSAHNHDFKSRINLRFYAMLPNIVNYLDHRISRDDLELCLSRLSAAVSNNLSCYLCGPQHMVDEITTTLHQFGVCHSNINTEKWW